MSRRKTDMEFELAVAPEIKWSYRDVANWISELGFPQYQVRLCQIYIIQVFPLVFLGMGSSAALWTFRP